MRSSQGITRGVERNLVSEGKDADLQRMARHSPMLRATPPQVCCTCPGTEPPRLTSLLVLGIACSVMQTSVKEAVGFILSVSLENVLNLAQ